MGNGVVFLSHGVCPLLRESFRAPYHSMVSHSALFPMIPHNATLLQTHTLECGIALTFCRLSVPIRYSICRRRRRIQVYQSLITKVIQRRSKRYDYVLWDEMLQSGVMGRSCLCIGVDLGVHPPCEEVEGVRARSWKECEDEVKRRDLGVMRCVEEL